LNGNTRRYGVAFEIAIPQEFVVVFGALRTVLCLRLQRRTDRARLAATKTNARGEFVEQRTIAEQVVLSPVQSELLAPEAVERFCELIRGWARSESAHVEQGMDPSIASIDAEIADLEALIEVRPARAATMRPLIEELRVKKANLRRGLNPAQLLRTSNPGFIESIGSGGPLRAL
jgi:hypothetical protein